MQGRAIDEASRLTFDQSWEQSGLFDIEQDIRAI
jgi:hypothetical protein